MIIPIPIFMKRETQADIDSRGRTSFQRAELLRKQRLAEEIEVVHRKLFTEDAAAVMAYRLFPNKAIGTLTLFELAQLGFIFQNGVKADFKED